MRKRLSMFLVFVLMFLLCAPGAGAEDGTKAEQTLTDKAEVDIAYMLEQKYVPGEIVVVMAKSDEKIEKRKERAESAAKSIDAAETRMLTYNPADYAKEGEKVESLIIQENFRDIYLFVLKDEADMESALKALNARDDVYCAEPNYIHEPCYLYDDNPDFVYADDTYPAEGYSFSIAQRNQPLAAETNAVYTDAESWENAFEDINLSDTIVFFLEHIGILNSSWATYLVSEAYVLSEEEIPEFPKGENAAALVIHSDGEEGSANKEMFDYSKVVTQEMIDWGILIQVYQDLSKPSYITFNRLSYPSTSESTVGEPSSEDTSDSSVAESESSTETGTASEAGSGTGAKPGDSGVMLAVVLTVVSLAAAGILLKKRAK